MVVGGDLLEAHDAGDAFDISVVAHPAVNAFDVLGEQFVLGAARFEFFRCIDDQDLVFPLLRFHLPEDKDAGGEAGAVKKRGPKADHRFEQIHGEELLPNLAFFAHPKERAVRKHHGHAPGLGGHGFDHVLDEGVVPTLGRRHAREVATVRVAGPDIVAPLLQGEGGIGNHAIESGKAVGGVEGGIAQSIATDNLKVRCAVEEEVHPGNGGGGEVFLLPKELAPECADIAARLLQMMDGLQQHAAGAAGRVIDGLALAGIEDGYHQPHNRARGVELACLFVGGVGEFFDKILIRLAEQIGFGHRVAQRELGEVLDEVAEERIRKAVFVCPLGIAEDPVKRVRIRLFNAPHGGLQGLPDIRSYLAHIGPVAVLGDLKAVVLGEERGLFIAVELLQRSLVFLVMHIGDAFEEEQGEDIGLEVGRIHRSAEDIGGFPEVGFQLGEGDAHRVDGIRALILWGAGESIAADRPSGRRSRAA